MDRVSGRAPSAARTRVGPSSCGPMGSGRRACRRASGRADPPTGGRLPPRADDRLDRDVRCRPTMPDGGNGQPTGFRLPRSNHGA